jgi:hypothetical protein
MDSDELVEIEDYLRSAWKAQFGRGPSALSADLDRLKELFKSGASAKRLREKLNTLPAIAGPRIELPQAVFVSTGDRRGLVTPEGRILLEELTRLRERGDQVLSREAVARANGLAAAAYGEWQREWLTQQVAGGGLRPGTYGFVLFLLLNGSVHPQSALPLPAEGEQERQLAESVAPVMNAFTEAIGGKPMSAREASRLRSNWRVTESRRQLFGRVAREDRGRVAVFWIDDEDATIDTIAQRLASRPDLSVDSLRAALEATVAAYSKARPALSAMGIAHDRRAHTEHVVRRLIDRFTVERATV